MASAMSNETDPARPAPEEPVPSRIHFHVVLGLILIPYLSAAVAWLTAILDVLRGYSNRTQLNWTRALVFLVVVDSLFVMGLVWTGEHKDELQKMQDSPPPPRSRIGAMFDADDRDAPPVLAGTMPGSPAEQAGLLPGDRILSVAGRAAGTLGDVQDGFEKADPGLPLAIRIRRADREQTLELRPEPFRKLGLFQPYRRAGEHSWKPNLLPDLPAFAAALLAWLVGWWRFRDRGRFWLVAVAALFLADVLALATGWILERSTGGISVGTSLLAMGVTSTAILAFGAAAIRFFPDARLSALPETPNPPVRAYFRGIFYLLTGGLRVAFLLMVADAVWLGAEGIRDPLHRVVEGTELGVGGSLLLVFELVILAPVGEELLFRGFLLPRLRAQGGDAWAVGASALFFGLLHPQYGIYMPVVVVYGLVLGWARLRTAGLGVPILLHLSINGLSAVMMLGRS